MKRVIAIASMTRFPRTASTTSRAFRGETRTPVTLARTSIVVPISPPCLAPTAPVSIFAVPAERPGRREFSELMADHLLGNENRNVNLAVVDRHSVTDHTRENRRRTCPGA